MVKVLKPAASFGKARRKVEHKKVAIVLRLACDILKMKPIHSTVGRMQGQGLMMKLSKKVKEYELDLFPEPAMESMCNHDKVCRRRQGEETHGYDSKCRFEVYKAHHHKTEIGKSQFTEIRSGNVLISSKMPHNVCGCKYHNNIILMIESLHRFNPDIIPLYPSDSFLVLRVRC